MGGLVNLDQIDLRIAPPYGAHEILYEVVEETTEGRFREGPNGETANIRRDDTLLGLALFMDVPAEEGKKTRLYFAASMITEAPNREVKTQQAPLANMKASFEKVREGEDGNEIDELADLLGRCETTIKERIQDTETNRSDIIEETLHGVRRGQSFMVRWGDAREEVKSQTRNQGKGKFGF